MLNVGIASNQTLYVPNVKLFKLRDRVKFGIVTYRHTVRVSVVKQIFVEINKHIVILWINYLDISFIALWPYVRYIDHA